MVLVLLLVAGKPTHGPGTLGVVAENGEPEGAVFSVQVGGHSLHCLEFRLVGVAATFGAVETFVGRDERLFPQSLGLELFSQCWIRRRSKAFDGGLFGLDWSD